MRRCPDHGFCPDLILGLALAAGLSGVTAAQGAARRWLQPRVVEAVPFVQPRAVYDGARARVVAFGVRGGNDTWEWNGAEWELRVSAGGSPPHWGGVLAYDEARRRVVYFGGVETNVPGETWLWDGGTWTRQVTAVAPPARGGGAMAYDPRRRRVVLFGGNDGQLLGDTWEWDGTAWRALAIAGPSPRAGHALAWDGVRRRLLLFGGWDDRGGGGGQAADPRPLDDTWVLEGQRWRQLAPAHAPSARAGHFMATDARGGGIVLAGGGPVGGGGGMADAESVWRWDGSDWVPGASTPALGVLGMAYDTVRTRLVMLTAGSDPFAYGGAMATWEDDGSGWSLRHTLTGPGTLGAAMTFDGAAGSLLLVVRDFERGSATWTWDGRAWTRRATRSAPYVWSPLLAHDTARGRTVLLDDYSRTWEWDGADWTMRAQSTGLPGVFAAMVHDASRRQTVLFGGRGGQRNVTFLWDGTRWFARNVQGPSPREFHGMAYDAQRERVVLFGGYDYDRSEAVYDTWEWDGAAWTLRNASTPLPPGQLVYDPDVGRVVRWGTERHEWDGSTWTRREADPMPARGHVVAYDTARRCFVGFGDHGTWVHGDFAPADAQAFGSACRGGAGAPHLASGVPYLGASSFSLDVRDARPGAACAFALAATRGRIDLGRGCEFLLGAPLASHVTGVDAHGFATMPLSIPDDPALRGATIFAQAVLLAPGGGAGLAVSAGRVLCVGD